MWFITCIKAPVPDLDRTPLLQICRPPLKRGRLSGAIPACIHITCNVIAIPQSGSGNPFYLPQCLILHFPFIPAEAGFRFDFLLQC